ncbi:hypothetical protein [Priestia megaterium]|uniref:hypothetical protein n=1 Tax=Priestia megaterium TaxID=1404 RepID=UPI0021015D2B|nr:hypothetical protein [Priestia megaterium]
MKKGISPGRETPHCYDKSSQPYYSMGCPQKIGGSYHGQSEKLLMGIENILRVASDLIGEVARLKSVEEECKILKEKVFMNQFTKVEQKVFALAIDCHSISKIQDILYEVLYFSNQHKKDYLIPKGNPFFFYVDSTQLHFT